MPRIVYYAFPTGKVQGGIKMTLRHVETLRDLGFDAVFSTTSEATMPGWLEYSAPVFRNLPVMRDDILVVPEEATTAIGQAARRRPESKAIILSQNQYILAALGLEAVDAFEQTRPLTLLVVGQNQARFLQRAYPRASIEIVPCFADERVFGPGLDRGPSISFVPKKREFEPKVIKALLRKLYPRHAAREWIELAGRTETEVARTFASSELFLSLNRFESVGMTTLEAMASGCVCAGFTGVVGDEYATTENGFWAPDDDCIAATEALAIAGDVVATGGPALRSILDASRETAAAWSYARFRAALEETWMRLAPEARVRNGPLD